MPGKSESIVVVGSINIDLVARSPRIPAPGETILGTDFKTFFGGKGANQAVGAARLGAPVCMIGQLGDDGFATQLRAGLNRAGVDTSAVGEVSGPSGVAIISTDGRGENSIIVVPGANSLVSPQLLKQNEGLIRNASVVLVQLEIPLETVSRLAEMTAESKVPLILDPAPARELPDDLLRGVEWITPNETETRTLLKNDMANPKEAAAELMKRGARNVVLKLGARGCFIGTADGKHKSVPAPAVTAIDTTAAGDAFNAAFAVALSRGQHAFAAAAWANVVAAVSVTRPGAQASMPTLDEVEAFASFTQS
jgi:ribokinase